MLGIFQGIFLVVIPAQAGIQKGFTGCVDRDLDPGLRRGDGSGVGLLTVPKFCRHCLQN